MKDLENNLNVANKCTLDKIEEMLVDTFATVAYGLNTKKACNRSKTSSISQSIWDLIRSLIPN